MSYSGKLKKAVLANATHFNQNTFDLERERRGLMKLTRTIMVLAVLLTLSRVTSAWAAFEAGGSVAVDFTYYSQDKEGFGGDRGVDRKGATPTTGGYAGLNDDWTTEEKDRGATFVDFSKTSYLWFRWSTETNDGLYVSPVLAGDSKQATGTGSLTVAFVSAFGWYRVTPALTIAVGKGMQDIFSPYDPATYVGYDSIGKVTGLGYGNINSKYQNGLKVKYVFSPKVTLNVGIFESRLIDPNNSEYTSFGPYIGFTKDSADTKVDNVTTLPKFELSMPLMFGRTRIVPSAMYLEQKFDNIASGADDTITTYGASLAAEINVGNFKLRGEYNVGQNWYDAAKLNVNTSYPFKSEYVAALGWAQSAAGNFLAPDGKLYDAQCMAFWVQGRLKLSRFNPTLFYGNQTAKRDVPTQEVDIETKMYGVNCPIEITKHLKITPEYMIYDNGDSNKYFHFGRLQATGHPTSEVYDCGRETVMAIQTRWTF